MTRKDDPALAAWLIERFGAEGEAAGLLDEDLVVGYAEGRLSEEEVDAVEQLLARDPQARDMLGLTRRVSEQPVVVGPSWSRWIPLAAAAAVLLALGAVLWSSGGDDPTLPSDPNARLLALADRLRDADAAFEGLRARMESGAPLAVPPVERGGVHVYAPRGEVLTTSPVLRWKAVPGATVYDLRVSPINGATVFEATVSDLEMELPATLRTNQPYVFEVTAKTAFGEAGGATSFRCAGADARAEHARAMEAIQKAASPLESDLLAAWYALSRYRYDAALGALRSAQARSASDGRVKRLRRVLEPLLP